MMQQFVVICVSTQVMPENFKLELVKILSDFKLEYSSFEYKQTSFSYSLKSTLSLASPENPVLHQSLMNLSSLFQIDIALIAKNQFEMKKRLVVFDMDSTLITAEVIDEMALKHGVGDKVKLITARAMNGELNFDQSLQERVALLKGFDRSHMEVIVSQLRFTPGTIDFLKHLKSLGIKTAIASGGFEYFARFVQKELQIDEVFANTLEFEGDKLSGKVQGTVVNAQRKEEIVCELAQKEGITLDQVVAIGDGANDIPMLLKAGLGIAIHAKEKVQKSAHYRINFGPMTHALSFMNHETL